MNANMEELVRDLDAAWASWDVERIISYFTDDCLYEDLAVGAAKRGKREVSDFLREFCI
jgi:ketosteroid isomerase-like protein